jgi:hypothetical protein
MNRPIGTEAKKNPMVDRILTGIALPVALYNHRIYERFLKISSPQQGISGSLSSEIPS